MSKQEFETFKRELGKKRSLGFIRLKDFIRIGSYDRKDFHRPVNVRLVEGSDTEIVFDVENYDTFKLHTVVVDRADVETFTFSELRLNLKK